MNSVDGIIISNTTLKRPFKGYGDEIDGGLSGKPLFEISTKQLKNVYEYTKGKIPLIVWEELILLKKLMKRLKMAQV